MSKTIDNLFGSGATFDGNNLIIDYRSLALSLGIQEWELKQSPNAEDLAALVILKLNQTTRLDKDESGFDIPNNEQIIVAPSAEPRQGFVTRDDRRQIVTTVFFSIYNDDLSKTKLGFAHEPLYDEEQV
ncbi:MAG: hypothetical protein AAFQ80_05515 [Cyanobacteria bacterium J06621_8]